MKKDPKAVFTIMLLFLVDFLYLFFVVRGGVGQRADRVATLELGKCLFAVVHLGSQLHLDFVVALLKLGGSVGVDLPEPAPIRALGVVSHLEEFCLVLHKQMPVLFPAFSPGLEVDVEPFEQPALVIGLENLVNVVQDAEASLAEDCPHAGLADVGECTRNAEALGHHLSCYCCHVCEFVLCRYFLSKNPFQFSEKTTEKSSIL